MNKLVVVLWHSHMNVNCGSHSEITREIYSPLFVCGFFTFTVGSHTVLMMIPILTEPVSQQSKPDRGQVTVTPGLSTGEPLSPLALCVCDKEKLCRLETPQTMVWNQIVWRMCENESLQMLLLCFVRNGFILTVQTPPKRDKIIKQLIVVALQKKKIGI